MRAAILSLPIETNAHRPEVSDFSHPLLNRLRLLARGCRTQARLDVEHACALLSSSACGLEQSARALVRAAGQVVERPLCFRIPGCKELSFDEEWLLRLLDRAAANDGASVNFLIASRIERSKRYGFRSLIRMVASSMVQ